jgi:pimeloyl-ACP methyl ester carboxylesterase
MVHESHLTVPGGRLFCRHTEIKPERPSVLLVHGLGESGLCFLEAFREPALERFNLVVPDLPGFGRSEGPVDSDYSFPAQVERLCALLEEMLLGRVHVVGHSMGGDIGTELCRLEPDRVGAFINIEGDLTQHDQLISRAALAAKQEGRFEAWFRDDFRRGKVREWSLEWRSCERYAWSLEMCRPEAFLASAHQIKRLTEAATAGEAGVLGERYRRLPNRKVFCWGTESLAPKSRQWLLKKGGLDNRPFEKAFHWVMIDRSEAFYPFAADFLLGREQG